MISLIIAAAAGGAAPELVQCRMMECAWSRPVSNVAVRSAPAGTLRKVTALRGTSAYRDEPPSGFDESLSIEWERKPSATYAFCSRSKPAFAFRSGKGWVAHALDLFDVGGYQTASAIGYLSACHGVDYWREDIETVLKGLGYRPGTRSEQVEIERPDRLLDLPRRAPR